MNSLTAEDEFNRHLANAESSVAVASRCWDALDQSRREECYGFLAMAVEELRASRSSVCRKSVSQIRTHVERLSRLQADASRLLRLVDASMSFCRGMIQRIGAAETDRGASGPTLTTEG